MKFLPFFQSLGFTRNETRVILVLGTTLLLGLAIRYYNSRSGIESAPRKEFDYSVADSIFRQRAGTPAGTVSPADDGTREAQTGFDRSPKPEPEKPVNINTATADELIRLPGIGPAYAQRIITYRKENGPFTSVDELENVKGIGEKRMERLRPFVRVK